MSKQRLCDEESYSDSDLNPFSSQPNENVYFLPAVLPRDQQQQQQQQQQHQQQQQNSVDGYNGVLWKETITQNTASPSDTGNFVFTIFYILGMSTMIPWNFFITAEDYWMFKFRNTSINDTKGTTDLTPMQKSFACDLTLTASLAGTTFLILYALYGQKISLRLKIYGPLSIMLTMFIVTAAFVEINTDKWQEQFFVITLFSVLALNVCSAILSGSVFGIAGLLPSEYMTAVVSGQALAGILTALIYLIILTFKMSPETTAFGYFSLGIFLIIMNIISYWKMERTQFFRYYIKNTNDRISYLPRHNGLEANVIEVLAKIYVHVVAIFILFATTLSIYPSVTILMQSENFGSGYLWNDIYFKPVVNYLLFNCGDYFGRILAGILERYIDNWETTLLSVFLRLFYIPLFLCSNSDVHQFLPILIHSDTLFIIMIISFAISNGYLANLLFTMVPRLVEQHEREMASSIMIAALSCGLVFGSMLSMIFVRIL